MFFFLKIRSRHEFALAIQNLRHNNPTFYGIHISASRQEDQLTDEDMEEFLALLRSKTYLCSVLFSLEITGHRLRKTLDLSFLPKLQDLALHRNFFTEMPKLFQPSMLKRFNMENNRLEITPYLPLYPRLKYVLLRNNNLSHDFIDLNKMDHLKKLDATDNNFMTVPLSNFKKRNVDYYVDSSEYSSSAKTLAFAANKQLGTRLYGYIRLREDMSQLRLSQMKIHFQAIDHHFHQTLSKNKNSLANSILIPLQSFVAKNFTELTTVTCTPQINALTFVQMAQIFSYIAAPIHPLVREVDKFEQVFASRGACLLSGFGKSQSTWVRFKQSATLSKLQQNAQHDVLKLYENLIRQICAKPVIQNRLILNHFAQRQQESSSIKCARRLEFDAEISHAKRLRSAQNA